MTRDGETAEQSAAGSFAAFISYSHADAGIAARLQRRLERYRLPKHVAGTGTDRALGRVFRDREDLAAAPSLSAAITDALSRSAALIVICSPAARQSRWVAEEIALFRQLHSDRPVLAAVVDGDPAVALPEALGEGGVEPLAADLRPAGDGMALGFLKIVAGMAGVPLDTLIQRDAQRRLRRVTWITLGALSAMLAMGVMTAFALSARNEAARQRAQAEGLVEYMLTDLREKLRGVGRIDVMDAVNARAMDHYSSQGDLSRLPDDSLERRARILHAMGEDDDKKDRPEAALAKFREAHRTTAALLARAPENPDRLFAHAQSEFWVGQAAWRKRDRPTAMRHWKAYRELAGRLIKSEPGSVRALMELGYSEGNLCDLLVTDRYDLVAAARHCTASIEYEAAALAKAPTDRKIMESLANRHGWMSEVHGALGKRDAEWTAREQEAELMDRLLALDPMNFEYALRRTWPDVGMADVLIDRQDYARARRLLARAEARLDKAAGPSPDSGDYWSQKLRIAYRQAQIARKLAPASAVAERMRVQNLAAAVKARYSKGSIIPKELFEAIEQLP